MMQNDKWGSEDAFLQLVLSSPNGFKEKKSPEDRSDGDEKLLASLLVDAVTKGDDYPQELLDGLDELLPEVALTESELSALLHALFLWSNADVDMRVGLENDFRYFRALCLVTDVGTHLKGIEPAKLLSLLSRTVQESSSENVRCVALAVTCNVVPAVPRTRGQPTILEAFKTTVRVVEKKDSAPNVVLALKILGVLPLQRHFGKVSGRLARTLCRAMTLHLPAKHGVDGDAAVRAAMDLSRELLALPSRHVFFGSIALVAKTKPGNSEEAEVLRGAVYIIGMALWGHNRVEKIASETPLSSVLQILRVAAGSGEEKVIKEIALSLRRLVKKYGPDLDVEWEPLLDIFESMIPYLPMYSPLIDTALELTALYLGTSVEALEDPQVEVGETKKKLLETSLTYEQVGNTLDKCKDFLPERTVLKLMQARASTAEPWRGLLIYVDVLQKLMTLYYRGERREQIRLKTLDTIRDAMVTYQGLYDDALVGEVLLPYIGQDPDGESSLTSTEELNLLFEIARDLPISDKRFSAVLEHFDERAKVGGVSSPEASRLLVELLYARMTRTPISRAVSVFKSLVGVHMHSPNDLSREQAIHAVSTISATSQCRIIGNGVQSYFLVSHLSEARKGRESATVILFPVQYALTNLLLRLREETSDEICRRAYVALRSLLSNVFVIRDCKLDALAAEMLSDLSSNARYTRGPSLRMEMMSTLYMLAGYGIEIEAITTALLDYFERPSAEGSQAGYVFNFLYGLVCQSPLDSTVERVLKVMTVYMGNGYTQEAVLICILECLKNLASVVSSKEIGSLGVSIVVQAVKKWQYVSDVEAFRWRRLCHASFIAWARKADPDSVSEATSMLETMAADGDILASACVEYIGCFVYEDGRTNIGVERKRPNFEAHDVSSVTFVGGPSNFQHLATIQTSRDFPAEIVQRRPTGTSRFLVESSNLPSALRPGINFKHPATGGEEAPGDGSGDVHEGAKADNTETADVAPADIQAATAETVNIEPANAEVADAETTSAKTTNAETTSTMRAEGEGDAPEVVLEASKTIDQAAASAWDLLHLTEQSLTPQDPTRLLCQLGAGAAGVMSIPENDEIVPHALSLLDRLPAEDTHRIGLIYVGEDDGDEASILDNIAGSEAYLAFLRRIGSFIRLGRTAGNIFTGGLDASGRDIDGEYCLHWSDSATQAVFHVTTLMPNSERSGGAVLKKRHVGNDHVNVVWSEKGPDFDAKVVDSHFNSVHIVVSPGGRSLYRVKVQVNRPETRQFGPLRPDIVQVVSEEALGPLVRATAINADVVCSNVPANWEERAKRISSIALRATKAQDMRRVIV